MQHATPTPWQAALDAFYGLANWETRPPGTLPSFELDRIRAVLADLGHPERRWPAVHVGGTNGKGSTCALLAAGLQASGYRTGLYTSPHMHTVRERIQVDGEPVGEPVVLAWLPTLRDLAARHPGLTTFEALTALAFDHFARAAVDVAVIEVGLGGRLDTTNVVAPAATVLTPIGLDHTQVLGDTVDQIAADKAGIFKPGVPVISAPQVAAAAAVVAAAAARIGAPVTWVGRDVTWRAGDATPWGQAIAVDVPGGRRYATRIGLAGPHQAVNAATAVAALDGLARAGWAITPATVAGGLAAARWPGRFECLRAPGAGGAAVVVDGAHNPPAAAVLGAALDACFPGRPRWLILGLSSDKDAGGILDALLGGVDRVIAARAAHPRAMPADAVAAAVAERGGRAEAAMSPAAALEAALAEAPADAVVVAAGSIFLAADVRLAWFAHEGLPLPPHDPPPG